jgi:phosphoribosylglycinamide formyltransferase-1
MKNIVILISGRGSNMTAIAEACASESWDARIAAIVSNKPDAAGLAYAQQQGIATVVVDHLAYADRAAFDAALAHAIDAFSPDLLVLAGFMRILSTSFVEHYAGRLLNIHPSLLPAFTGLHTHRRAIEAGCKLAGTTVHLVTPELDHGPIIIQAAVPVLQDDTEDTLANRVLEMECIVYPRAVRWWVHGELDFTDATRVRHRFGAPQWMLPQTALGD